MTRKCKLVWWKEIKPCYLFVWDSEPRITGYLEIDGEHYEIAGVIRKELKNDRSRDRSSECNSD